MPLLRRQPFLKQKAPAGLKDDDEVFVCKLTGEMFCDYEKFFERIILCNSLVWTCEITGKSGLTYQEALDSEEKANKQVATLQDSLQKPILYLCSLTHRSRLIELNDDIYGYVKDRYFIGETVDIVQRGDKKRCKVIKVILPSDGPSVNGKAESCASSTIDSDSDVVCLDDPPKPQAPSKESSIKLRDCHPDDVEYVVQEVKKNNIFIMKGEQIHRKKGLFTREKCKMYLKSNCAASTTGIWKVKEKLLKKFKVAESKFSDFFEGNPPAFKIAEAKRKPSGVRTGTFIDLTEEDKVIKQAKKEMKQKKKQWKEAKKKEKEEMKKVKKQVKKRERKKQKAVEPEPVVEPSFDELRKMSAEEKLALKESQKAERLAARQALVEENKKKREEEKNKKKEERDKERDQRRADKLARDEYLKEWSKPRDDLECDDLADLPTPTPIQSYIPTELFGDAVMLLEYLHCFGTLMDIDSQFPNGISLGDLGKAMMETDTNGLFSDILRIFLTTLFQLQEEEDEEIEEGQQLDIKGMKITENKSFKELVENATLAAQWPQLHYSTNLKQLPLDNFTMTEILRLHFLSSGAKASDENIRFRYQQRGVYTPHDDAGLEFRREEGHILKALSHTNVFDLGPGEKLKILAALIRQVLTFVATRDMIEDNQDRLRTVQNELRHHRWAEQRRDKEEAAYWYKKRLEERAKEKELVQQRKEEKKKAKIDKLAQDEGAKNSIAEDSENVKEAESKDDLALKEGERHSTRQKDKIHAKQDAEFFDTPIENIQWDKITPDDRIRIKEKHAQKESDLLEIINQVQHGSTISPLGRDRTFRRYWIFRSIPGLFVEDQEDDVPSDYFVPVPQIKPEAKSNETTNVGAKIGEDKSTSSDKENESFEHDKSACPPSPISSSDNLVNGIVKPILSDATVNGVHDDNICKMEVTDVSASKSTTVHDQIAQRNQVCWAYYSPDQLDALVASLNSRGYREGALKATILDQKQFVEQRMQQIPTSVLSLSGEEVEKNGKNVRYQNVKSRNKTMQGAVMNSSAAELLELNLREMLLDIEERIYVGSLGFIKVNNRVKWRDAIEEGSYKCLNDELTWAGQSDTLSTSVNIAKGEKMEEGEELTEDTSPAVRDLAKALLQIEQAVDAKYLANPLGEDEATKKQKQKAALEAAFKGLREARGGASKKSKGKGTNKEESSDSEEDTEDDNESIDKLPLRTARERWEASVMSVTSLSQVFLHLGVLEASIIWSKSSLHARCRICRRKGDGDKMLLCDGCDRGHHMYCLKPPVKKIPTGDWYCPDCRPKDIPKTPRKRRKSVFEEESADDQGSDDESAEDEEDSSDDDSSSDESDDDSDDDSDEDTEEDTEEEEEEEQEETPKITKIKFIKGGKKGGDTSKRSNAKAEAEPSKASRSRRSQETSGPSSRASSQERDKPSRSKKSDVVKSAVESAKSSKRKLEIEEKAAPKKTSRRSLDIPATSRSSKKPAENKLTSRRSLDSVKTTSKRKRDDNNEEEELPQSKRSISKSRGGGEKIDTLKVCENLLLELYDRNEAWPFMKPVSKRDAPDYFDIVKHPMDFSTMRNRINRFEYIDPADILTDIRLTLKNCEQYNMPTAPEFQAGQKLSRYFEKRVRELQLTTLSAKKSPTKGASPKGKTPSPGARSSRQK